MSDDIGCPECAHLCSERDFRRVEDWLSWIAEEHILEAGSILEAVYEDVSLEEERMTAAFKCVACGQLFMHKVNYFKSNKIKVAANWKPVVHKSP